MGSRRRGLRDVKYAWKFEDDGGTKHIRVYFLVR